MRLADIPFHPSVRTLRQFAGIWIVAGIGLACWQWFRHENPVLTGIFAAVTLVGVWGCWRPLHLKPIFVGWMILTFPIAWTISTLVLACLFFLMFTPLGLFFRMIGRDPLDRQWDPQAATYWQPKGMSSDPKSYLNQF